MSPNLQIEMRKCQSRSETRLLNTPLQASIARLPTTKRSLRTYRLNMATNIQMLTALVLQLIQCTVVLPKKLAFRGKGKKGKKQKEEEVMEIDGSGEVQGGYSIA